MRTLLVVMVMLLSLAMVSAECFDSDEGKNKYDFGGVTEDGKTYQDSCEGTDIKEYFCSVDGVASYTILPCVNGCNDGACQLANEKPVSRAPEENGVPMKWYFYGAAIVIILILYIYWFKWRPRRKRF